MPPKSSAKKTAVLWYNCEKCDVIVTSRDRDTHEKNCPIDSNDFKHSFVRNEILFTTSLEINRESEETSTIPLKQLNNLIFISESAIRLCNFFIGEKVAISCPEKPELAPLVRLVWPSLDQYTTTVFVSGKDYAECWSSFKNLQLKIEKLSSEPLPASQITLDFVKHDAVLDTPDILEEIARVLMTRLRGLVFCVQNEIFCDFYNKEIIFSVYNIEHYGSSSLEEGFQRLNIKKTSDRTFFAITNGTKVKVRHSLRKEPNNSVETVQVTKQDIGGLKETIQIIEESMNIALGFQAISDGVKISRGMLLFGPTGCGKTMLCEALANDTSAEVIRINTNQIFSRFFGETESNLQKNFEDAYKHYPSPTVIIVEDVNNICPKTETNEVVKRTSACFLGLLDSLYHRPEARRIFVLVTSTNIENLNPALRRCGRIDSEVEICAPSPLGRKDILVKHLRRVNHNLTDSQVRDISNVTHGYVGSDLANLVYKAAVEAIKGKQDVIESVHVNFALGQVKPSAMREVLIENPNVRWEDIGGQDDLKLKLKQAIKWPLIYPEKFEKLGIRPPRGILMFGPPGCSKTMIAKALATESQVNFLSIKGPELFSMWVGESERAVREVFRKARQVAPSIIFFDEIDAIGGERSSESGSSVKERVLAQMLTELDGVNMLQNVTVIAATNRPDMIDKALLRPGRIDRIVYVGLPDVKTRHEIFSIKLRRVPTTEDVSIDELAKRTSGYSGAEIQAVCNEAAFKALEESLDTQELRWGHFEVAMKIVQPRTSQNLLRVYAEYMKKDGL